METGKQSEIRFRSGEKIDLIRLKNFKLYDGNKPVLIYAITKDKSNTIWAGGFTTGLLKYNPSLGVFEKIFYVNFIFNVRAFF